MSNKSTSSESFINGVVATLGAVAALVAIYEFVIKPRPGINVSPPPALQTPIAPTKESQSVMVATDLPSVATGLPKIPTPSPLPQSLGKVTVLGNSEKGIQVKISKTGLYRFMYKSGAYATYQLNRMPSGVKAWLTAVIAYKGNSPAWDGKRIRHEDAFLVIADNTYFSTSQEAQTAASEMTHETYLKENEVITLVAVDEKGAYGDNPGSVTLEIFFVP